MSGHSKWSKIQHKKGATDAKRGNMFTKLAKAITVAAQQGGGDPLINFSLRIAIEKAKATNMPKDNIERALKRGTGELTDVATLQENIYEGYGPNGIAVLVETVTDNSNRTAGEVKHAFSKHGGSMGGPGSVQWQFERKAVVRFTADKKVNITNWEDAQLALMDIGVEDIRDSAEGVELIAPMECFKAMMETLEKLGIVPDDSGLQWLAKEEILVDDDVREKMAKLYGALDELDDVKDVYTNEA